MAISFLAISLWMMFLNVKGENGCKVLHYLSCRQSKTLTGHVINSSMLIPPGLELCQSKCFQEKQCMSYNLGPVHGQRRSCELNAADHSTRPNFLVDRTGYEYCPIKNSCQSNPCPPGRLCTPDFAWNTYSCDDGGWTQWGSWAFPNCSVLPSICKRARNRSCTSPPPQGSGLKCSGLENELKECKPLPVVNIVGCQNPFGMEDGRITNGQIKASSTAKYHVAWNGRLNKKKNAKGACWAAGKKIIGDWIQIDLNDVKVVTMVATQGRQDCCSQWVTKFSLKYSMDEKDWNDYYGDCTKVFAGNKDGDSIVKHVLEIPIRTRFIRLVVKEFHDYPSLRMELYGCPHLTT